MKPLQKALTHLQRSAARAGPGGRLPSVKSLAAEAGVSTYTLGRALGLLRSDGLLDVRQRSGITVRAAPAVAARATDDIRDRHLPRWQQVARVLSRRIRRTRTTSRRDPLLSKAVCVEFGVSYPTARKALDDLVDRHVLQPFGRGFIPVGAEGYGGLAVLCVTRRHADFEPTSYWQPPTMFSAQFEQVCSIEGVPFEYAFVGYRESTFTGSADAGRALHQLARRRTQAMAMVSSAGISDDALVELCEHLQRARAPVAVVNFEPDNVARRLPPYRLGITDVGLTRHAGPTMAEFLMRREYRSVWVVAYETPLNWQAERIAGIRERLAENGADMPVRVVRILEEGGATYQGPTLDASAPDWESLDQRHQRVFRQLAIDSRRATSLHMLRESVRDALQGLTQKGLPDIIVGTNDDIAIACLDVLRGEGIDVPGTVAVAGFDDSPDAFSANLTSYSHNWQAIAREILRFGMTCGEHDKGPVPLDVGGSIVERLTTG